LRCCRTHHFQDFTKITSTHVAGSFAPLALGLETVTALRHQAVVMQGHLGLKPCSSSCIRHPLPTASRRLSLLPCRGTAGQHAAAASVSAPLQQYPAAQQPLPQGQGPSCKLDRNSGALERDEYGKFVQFFRQASPYIEGHRSRTFVVVIPGAAEGLGAQMAMAKPQCCQQLQQDMHTLCTRVVCIPMSAAAAASRPSTTVAAPLRE
jgi:hypothetical protein